MKNKKTASTKTTCVKKKHIIPTSSVIDKKFDRAFGLLNYLLSPAKWEIPKICNDLFYRLLTENNVLLTLEDLKVVGPKLKEFSLILQMSKKEFNSKKKKLKLKYSHIQKLKVNLINSLEENLTVLSTDIHDALSNPQNNNLEEGEIPMIEVNTIIKQHIKFASFKNTFENIDLMLFELDERFLDLKQNLETLFYQTIEENLNEKLSIGSEMVVGEQLFKDFKDATIQNSKKFNNNKSQPTAFLAEKISCDDKCPQCQFGCIKSSEKHVTLNDIQCKSCNFYTDVKTINCDLVDVDPSGKNYISPGKKFVLTSNAKKGMEIIDNNPFPVTIIIKPSNLSAKSNLVPVVYHDLYLQKGSTKPIKLSEFNWDEEKSKLEYIDGSKLFMVVTKPIYLENIPQQHYDRINLILLHFFREIKQQQQQPNDVFVKKTLDMFIKLSRDNDKIDPTDICKSYHLLTTLKNQ